MDSKILNARFIGIFIALIFGLLIPLGISDYWRYVLTIALFYSIMAVSWNLLSGYTGQFSLGHHTFAMIGAYASTLLMLKAGVSFWVSIPTAIIIAAMISTLLGVLCLRVSGLFLALITWAFAEVARNYIRLDYAFTGGDRGLESPLLFETMAPLPYYYLFLALTIFSIILITFIMKSRIGFFLRSIREDEISARSMGVDITRYKIFSFIVASSLASMAGIFYGHSIGLISPKMGNFNEMAMIVIFVVIGGIRTLSGPIAGAIIVRFLMELLREYSEWRIVILCAIVIIIMRFFNGGMIELFKRVKEVIQKSPHRPESAYK